MASHTAEPTGRPKRLATYTADVGERMLVGQRTDGGVRISDVQADGQGRSYLVEPEVSSMAEIEALVADYTAKAQKLGYVPMHGCGCGSYVKQGMTAGAVPGIVTVAAALGAVGAGGVGRSLQTRRARWRLRQRSASLRDLPSACLRAR
jgi:hypothetical protein